MKASLSAVLAACALSSCLVLPKVDMNQPVPCPLVSREVTLDMVQMGNLGHCRGDECLMLLTAGSVVFAASVLVSGSVALVGNTIHWIERTGKCAGRTPASTPPAPAPSAPSS